MNTELLYMHDMMQTSCEAIITDVKDQEGGTVIILDQTICYPQGGGQPCDIGTIQGDSFVFEITDVRFVDGVVQHKGIIREGTPNVGDRVVITIDEERRALNTRYHSAGHVIDVALRALGIDWKPTKGYHAPVGAYVEYMGDINSVDVEQLKKDLEEKCASLIESDIQTVITFDEVQTQNGKLMRIVTLAGESIPCGGTHVSRTGEIGTLTIRKIKKEKDAVRVSYSI